VRRASAEQQVLAGTRLPLAATIAGNPGSGSWQDRLRQCQIQITYALFDSRPAENRLSLQLTFLESQGKSETGLFIDTEPA
jgi:hypothetical protein